MTAVETISVVVGHEDALPRDILASACAAGPVALVGCCAKSAELIERCTTMRPDVVVLSETIDPDVDGVIATLQGLAGSIIMIGGNPSPERLMDLLSRGLQGHLLYDTSPEELAAGIQAVARGVVVINPAVVTMLVEHWRWVQTDVGSNGTSVTRSLTPREHDVLVAMVEGLSTKAVARRLGVAFKTVENHKIRVFEKLGVRTHAQAVSVAINYGLVSDIPRDVGVRVRGGRRVTPSRRVLVTGGAGFIGSHLADALLERGDRVRILDDLSAGTPANVPAGAELVVGDAADRAVVDEAVAGCEVVFHLAAHRAVLKSVEDPLTTDTANIHGTLTVLDGARRAGVRRVVSASSSSVYGGAERLPTPEDAPIQPRSPYAVTKMTGEAYCRVYWSLYGLETVMLRYFNVYGPRQRPDSAYAAVIPLFVDALAAGRSPVVHGDGEQSRDFTYVADAVQANLAASDATPEHCTGSAYNISGGRRATLLELLEVIGEVTGWRTRPEFSAPRAGDVRDSHADISAARRALGYRPLVDLRQGLTETVRWQMSAASPDRSSAGASRDR